MSFTGFNSGGPSGNRFFTSLMALCTPFLLSLDIRSLGQNRRTDDMWVIKAEGTDTISTSPFCNVRKKQ